MIFGHKKVTVPQLNQIVWPCTSIILLKLLIVKGLLVFFVIFFQLYCHYQTCGGKSKVLANYPTLGWCRGNFYYWNGYRFSKNNVSNVSLSEINNITTWPPIPHWKFEMNTTWLRDFFNTYTTCILNYCWSLVEA